MTNRIRNSIQNKGVALGTWAQMGSAEFCEISGRSGLDFVIVDMEHGSFGLETAVNMMRAADATGASPIIRVPDAGKSTIAKVLDAGAHGVLVPSVGTAETARAIVEAAYYSPRGMRGACPCVRGNGYGVQPWSEYIHWCDKTVMVSIIIETPEGVANFREIVAVPGLDVIALGPFDLSQAMGFNGDWKHPAVRKKQEEIVDAALNNGLEVMPSIFDSHPLAVHEQIRDWQALGVRMFAISGDRFMLSSGFKSILEEASPSAAIAPLADVANQ